MNIFASKRSHTAFALKPVAAGCALLIAAAVAPAHAQTTSPGAEDAKLQSVTVSGIRRGIEDAISVKKDSSSIVEAISAEDIGKLPDVSIAESISRLPGLAAQRVGGRAQQISVRGLSPDFSTTLLNGREQVSTGDNRSVEFDQYPSELISGVTIYKTPDAGMIGQGLSGTIDMQTVRPLSFQTRAVALNARGEKNSLGSIANAKSTGNRFSASYIDQFANRTIGIALGFAHLESPVLDNETGLYEPWKKDGRPGVPAGTYIMDGIKAVARSGKNERDGFMGVLQYRPNKQWTSMIDVYASEFRREETANQIEINLGGWNGNNTPAFGYTNAVVSSGALASATANGVYPLVRGMYNDRKDKIRAFGWNNTVKLDDWTLVGDISISKAKRNELSLENNSQLGNGRGTNDGAGNAYLDTAKLTFNTGTYSSIGLGRDYSNPATLFIGPTIYGSGYGKVPRVEDELKSFKLVASAPIPTALDKYVTGIDFGVNYSDRSKKKRQPEGNINLKGTDPVSVSSGELYGSADLGFAGVGSIPTWNVPAMVSKYMTFNPTDTESYLISKAWDVNEKITTAFLKTSFESEFGDVTMRGNAGIQAQHTDQSSDANYYDGTAPAGAQVKPVHDGKTYTDYLPSVNVSFQFDGGQTLRFAAAKQIARPRVDQLRSALDFGVSDTTFKPGGSGGNAKLDPWRANAFDVSYEKYFDKKAYFAVAGFYKKLNTYIFTQTKDYDFSKFIPGTKALYAIGDYSAPYNGKGGILKGAELSASAPLSLISKSLDGFGVQASHTYSDSSIAIDDPSGSIGKNIPLPGLSKHTTNLTVYFEKNGFETRINQRKRSDFVGEIGNFNGERSLRYVVGENVVDFQIGYTFNEGSLKGMGVVLQVNNLTNAAYETYTGTANQQLEYQKYGRTILAGLNYKF
ncbi:TonB-dependent receptor [Duganella sp. CF402]|uniref:TonB-dependent receptor n=1 Tax=unclassified Duganella TaxID=2636909 RepID=UPI0008BBABD4|nr:MULTISPECIES: TonB-dependent receptor [unclassified Duganella]RZT08814.1 TonB-dependent receptor [Duganella sp. BK701]SEL80945.1 TonB-dependent receptor [Duganella sp. CF402]